MVFFFPSVSHSSSLSFSPSLSLSTFSLAGPRDLARPRKISRTLRPVFFTQQRDSKTTLSQRRMSAALSSRPLLGKASAPLSAAAATATTTKTAPTNASQRTNASADSAASAPSYASTSRVLASGTTSSLWLDRSALAYDILIGQVRANEGFEQRERRTSRRSGRASKKHLTARRATAAVVEALFFLHAPVYCSSGKARSMSLSHRRRGQIERRKSSLEAKPQRNEKNKIKTKKKAR